ncbi:Cytochrome oxidase biogenesis protein Sco1/SenC/PrrC, thiol-disulfide reductase involved in Cu(I) insertion into CoxII Cu(A) center [hydrothermal vent metagenome]|uniref:Cytochrome oxidase biogenesis protein Sco1/SenC/PrrC, thiol-disulfide reductase involved in Cu(I) insertion into CoxII Cu(A) center n=1 Tax=hydrothermal vent metagenome TaxID=652676 RepID=A0A3B0TB62_9ZZZZ
MPAMTTVLRRRINLALKTTAFGLVALAVGLLAWVGTSQYFGRSPVGGGEGTANVGGPFTAIDHTGRAVSEKDFLGRYMLVFFGYTSCPDVCPGELQIIAAALDLLGAKAVKVRPVFFTIDPARDTPEVLAKYVANFHATLVGLTGTDAQMAAVAKAYYVYFSRSEDIAPPGDYLMDHSSLLFLMDGEGRYVRHFNYGTPPEEIATALEKIIQ